MRFRDKPLPLGNLGWVGFWLVILGFFGLVIALFGVYISEETLKSFTSASSLQLQNAEDGSLRLVGTKERAIQWSKCLPESALGGYWYGLADFVRDDTRAGSSPTLEVLLDGRRIPEVIKIAETTSSSLCVSGKLFVPPPSQVESMTARGRIAGTISYARYAGYAYLNPPGREQTYEIVSKDISIPVSVEILPAQDYLKLRDSLAPRSAVSLWISLLVLSTIALPLGLYFSRSGYAIGRVADFQMFSGGPFRYTD